MKKYLPIAIIPILGLILLNLTFLLDFIFQTLFRAIVGLFIPIEPMNEGSLIPPVMHGMFVVLISMVSWVVFKSKLKTLIKATFSVVPLAVVYATIGMFLYRWPIAVYIVGGVFGAGVFYYLYTTKKPWLYFYSAALISLAMLIGILFGMEI